MADPRSDQAAVRPPTGPRRGPRRRSHEPERTDRTDGRDDGADWAENYSNLPSQPGIALILVVPAEVPHKFVTAPGGYEAVHIHSNDRFETTWLE